MNIAIIADPYIPVPPQGYGGIERIIDMLIKEYLKRGHKVALWGHPDSKPGCEVIPYGVLPHWGFGARTKELWQVASMLYKRRKNVDVVHSFSRLAGMLPLYFYNIPKIQSYQRKITKRNVWLVSKFTGNRVFFTACSDSFWLPRHMPGNWQTIYNGVPIEKFHFRESVSDDAPLVFLGRLEEEKGPDIAIAVARLAGRKLILAGNVVTKGESLQYFKTKIEPFIDGINIKYVGETDDNMNNELLGKAAALLLPSVYVDPCPVVMLEALACGTPVIGLRTGGIPEVIKDGVNGFVCDTKEEMAQRVRKIKEISRKRCRQITEAKFSSEVIAEEYLALYKKLLAF